MNQARVSARRLLTLVIGGYGNFGARISLALARIPGLDVVVAGRSAGKAEAFATAHGLQACVMDVGDEDLVDRFRNLGAGLVISTAGPFSGQDYRLADAAVAAGAHYFDIADDRQYVCGITALDSAAREAGVLLVSGASSVPALSGAVVDRYAGDFARMDSIHHAISTSAKTPGLATVKSALSYCGKSMAQWREGQWRQRRGWQGISRLRFPRPIGARWVVDCDVADLTLFPRRYAPVRSVVFKAGVDSVWVMLGSWGLSWLVRFGLLNNAALYANRLLSVARSMERFGGAASAMQVRLRGIDHKGDAATLCWTLRAGENHGISIPCMAVVALARKLAQDRLSVRGAMPCVGLLSLDEYLAELAGLDIKVDCESSAGISGE